MTAIERMMAAACNLSEADLRLRVAEWHALRSRTTSYSRIEGGVSLELAPGEPLAAVADLASRESDCCPFYSFALRVEGNVRRLEISAGPGGEPAVEGLLGLLA